MSQRTRDPIIADTVETPSLWSRVKLGTGVTAIIALGLFLLSNLQAVDIRFLGVEWHTRMLWAILVSAIVGALATIVGGAITSRGKDH